MGIMIEVKKMNCDYVLQYLKRMEVPIVSKKNHDIIMCGLEKMIFLKEGVVKVSSILEDGREYNITYAKGPNLLSLMCDTLREDVAYRIRIRVESEEASFCLVSREDFSRVVKQDEKLKEYVEAYYRENLQRALYRQKCMTMNAVSYTHLTLPTTSRRQRQMCIRDRICRSQMMILLDSVVFLQETASTVFCVD